jgi:hypothetical protein
MSTAVPNVALVLKKASSVSSCDQLKPKATAGAPDTLVAATQRRGVYRYQFADPVKPAARRSE